MASLSEHKHEMKYSQYGKPKLFLITGHPLEQHRRSNGRVPNSSLIGQNEPVQFQNDCVETAYRIEEFLLLSSETLALLENSFRTDIAFLRECLLVSWLIPCPSVSQNNVISARTQPAINPARCRVQIGRGLAVWIRSRRHRL